MTVGELFVNLGIKGSEKTVGALTNVKKGMGDVASVSLEAKAAIIGAMYALERLSAQSGAMGTNLANFNALTGLNVKSLQQWQFAARQAGLSGDEFAGSIKALQSNMTNMLLGKGAPEGMGLLASTVGFDPKRARDTFYVLEQLQKFAQKVPPDIAKNVMSTFGISEGTIAAMRRNAFEANIFRKAPIYSDREIAMLDRANIAWSNLGMKIEMAIGKFNARHGLQLINDISNITTQVVKLGEEFTKLSEKISLFEGLGHAAEGFANVLKLINELLDRLGGGTAKKGDLLYTSPGQSLLPGFADSPVGKFFRELVGGDVAPPPQFLHLPLPINPGQKTPQNINVHQTLEFRHPGTDHLKTADSVRKAVQDSYRQMSAQGQGS